MIFRYLIDIFFLFLYNISIHGHQAVLGGEHFFGIRQINGCIKSRGIHQPRRISPANGAVAIFQGEAKKAAG